MKQVEVKQNAKEEIPIEVLATNIRAIAAGIKVLRKGPLGEKTLLLLISENCRKKNKWGYGPKVKVAPATVKSVLDSIESLQEVYLK